MQLLNSLPQCFSGRPCHGLLRMRSERVPTRIWRHGAQVVHTMVVGGSVEIRLGHTVLEAGRDDPCVVDGLRANGKNNRARLDAEVQSVLGMRRVVRWILANAAPD